MADRKGGFPHSEITGSKGARASPVLIAACHVLHRLSMPRHPLEALMRLIVLSKTHALLFHPGTRGRQASSRWNASVLFICQIMMSFSDPTWPTLACNGRTLHSRCQSRRRITAQPQTCHSRSREFGGARRDRTDDLMLAKHALYQLSYGPKGRLVWEHPVSRVVVDLSVRPRCHTRKCGGPRRTRTADLTLIRRVL